jgi:8-oxo-dGTP pyrophosphatase MutT (NUDIX family)
MIWTPHVTVAAVIEENNRFLLIEEQVENVVVINQPAGHLDNNESLLSAVKRETLEETAYVFSPEHITGIYQWRHPQSNETYLRVSFCGKHTHFDPTASLDAGIIKTRWLTRDELLNQNIPMRSPMVLQCIDHYLAGYRYPLSLISNLA